MYVCKHVYMYIYVQVCVYMQIYAVKEIVGDAGPFAPQIEPSRFAISAIYNAKHTHYLLNI